MQGTLVVAGLWVRPLAESARQAGWKVIALDLFGDTDTRRASIRWERIGEPSSLAIAPALLRDALHDAAREPGVAGWVAGSGFEALTEELEAPITGLPLLGMPAAAIRRVRDPATFFSLLDGLRLEHPEVALEPPAAPEGWLAKSAAGSGGWHIHPAENGARPGGRATYWQRMQVGVPLSALFVADGRRAVLVALNRLIVRPLGGLPFVYHGALGPIRDAALTRHMEAALSALVPALGLRGLASLDFLADGSHAWLLEINARPTATMALHPGAWPGGLMQAHVQALQGELPRQPAFHPAGLRGCLTVFADRACRMGLALSAELALSANAHDVPAPGACFAEGEPVCTLSGAGDSMEAVLAALDARGARLRERLGAREELAI
ncbi:ATP-grasp domain-containing protein [Ramlibacter sp. G-1-2-2]|uniref:ATP-grasp domain-containing protein n=1 Tax=Ramlibacter agri TaxID=2728837 RepID=A0A848HAT8_9BURK|nr:ATP-grasp domain-containing protein [Ramlibacter agri]NML45583.1 ATP-grasp domain-containing protein [Ramlibacter agri]